VALCVDRRPAAAGARVCQGLADLAFLPDGNLVAAANAPKSGPGDGGGALWLLRAVPGGFTPELLQRFDGLKPEGVTLAPGGRSLMVVFDSVEDPRWMELPIPVDRKP